MQLDRLTYESSQAIDFVESGLKHQGALCERTWHDRLLVVAEGASARLWNPEGMLHEVELWFPAGGDTSPRRIEAEVFPGCPLIFRLAESLLSNPISLERLVLEPDLKNRGIPSSDIGIKLWQSQYPTDSRIRLKGHFAASHHFSLVSLVRAEIQAIDQHWMLVRTAAAFPGGEPDPNLAAHLGFAAADPSSADISWPVIHPSTCMQLVSAALEFELEGALDAIRTRQENYSQRELERIDAYFEGYEAELSQRFAKSSSETLRAKLDSRRVSAAAEHARRRADQVERHQVTIVPHVDALLLVAELAWRSDVSVFRDHREELFTAHFVPRARRWFLCPESRTQDADPFHHRLNPAD